MSLSSSSSAPDPATQYGYWTATGDPSSPVFGEQLPYSVPLTAYGARVRPADDARCAWQGGADASFQHEGPWTAVNTTGQPSAQRYLDQGSSAHEESSAAVYGLPFTGSNYVQHSNQLQQGPWTYVTNPGQQAQWVLQGHDGAASTTAESGSYGGARDVFHVDNHFSHGPPATGGHHDAYAISHGDVPVHSLSSREVANMYASARIRDASRASAGYPMQMMYYPPCGSSTSSLANALGDGHHESMHYSVAGFQLPLATSPAAARESLPLNLATTSSIQSEAVPGEHPTIGAGYRDYVLHDHYGVLPAGPRYSLPESASSPSGTGDPQIIQGLPENGHLYPSDGFPQEYNSAPDAHNPSYALPAGPAAEHRRLVRIPDSPEGENHPFFPVFPPPSLQRTPTPTRSHPSPSGVEDPLDFTYERPVKRKPGRPRKVKPEDGAPAAPSPAFHPYARPYAVVRAGSSYERDRDMDAASSPASSAASPYAPMALGAPGPGPSTSAAVYPTPTAGAFRYETGLSLVGAGTGAGGEMMEGPGPGFGSGGAAKAAHLRMVDALEASQTVLRLNPVRRTVERKQAMACLFCRERKIACGPPLPGSTDDTCNQCARRDLPCEYPKENRRGQHKRKSKKEREEAEAAALAAAVAASRPDHAAAHVKAEADDYEYASPIVKKEA